LAAEQRRAVLHALKANLDPDVTMGDVLDAADALGFGEELGGLSLQDLADALLTPTEEAANSGGNGRRHTVPAAGPDERPAKAAAKPVKSSSKPKPQPKPAPKSARLRSLKKRIDADERMNLEEAAELFVPLIEEMAQATMQDIEEFTGVGRRKLRFHIGQLVREGYIERHGMGRGTYYTPV
jgi:DNA-binding transcriptional ArsR family regulator